jgi:gag-polyprotein putative aspartyl protease
MEKGHALSIDDNPDFSPSVAFSSIVQSAFDMPYKTVLITRGTIQNISCKILIDPGAEINYISSAFAQRHKISTKESEYSAEWVQGTTEQLRETNNFLKLEMGSTYSEELPFSVMPLHRYDVIIGKQWLAHYNPEILMRTDELSFLFLGNPVTVNADITKECQFMFKKNFRKDWPKEFLHLQSTFRPETKLKQVSSLKRMIQFNLFLTNSKTSSLKIYQMVYRQNEAMTSKSYCNPFQHLRRDHFISYLNWKPKSCKNNWPTFWTKDLSNPAQVPGDPPSYLLAKRMAEIECVSIIEP